jgi:hypothetical protein
LTVALPLQPADSTAIRLAVTTVAAAATLMFVLRRIRVPWSGISIIARLLLLAAKLAG